MLEKFCFQQIVVSPDVDFVLIKLVLQLAFMILTGFVETDVYSQRDSSAMLFQLIQQHVDVETSLTTKTTIKLKFLF